MTQNNLYMEDDNMRLYVDVQPLFIDELENSKNSAAASAASAAQSEANARTWKNDIIDYKTSLELFYAQARDGITNSYNNSVSDLTSVRNLAYDDLNSQKNSIRTSLNNSLNSALTSISTNGQNYVNQAREYAEQAQNTVDNRVSKDLLIQSNAFKAGSVSTNMDVLAEVNNYAHSTFDKSKFTVVGSPVITDDGIASGFSDSTTIRYVKTPNTINFSTASSWEINFAFETQDATTEDSYISGNTNQYIGLALQNGKFRCSFGDGSSWFSTNNQGTKTILNNTEYKVSVRYDGTNYSWYINGELDQTVQSNSKVGNTEILIGVARNSANSNFVNKKIDLKQFSITVDGVEVFSGNKTGMDTIKPDDYTVVGTPTITNGILSNCSANDYLKKTIDATLSADTDVEVHFTFKTPATFPNGTRYIWGRNYKFCNIINASYIGVQFLNGQAGADVALDTNTVYDAIFKFDKAKLYFQYKKHSNTNWVVSNPVTYAPNTTTTLTDTLIGTNANDTSRCFTGSIDLNAFKIYVDGNLVYQPCLKIPYTESKTGSKVVSSPYRDRVADMSAQFGYANYYTLDEDNGNFTLPQVELYGLIGQRTLRDSYRNGINYWELYSNRDLEQGGSCTSGVEVTFARPFADTNYVLSVPYSAKSSTAFTPTQTGDWIAKGKGLL